MTQVAVANTVELRDDTAAVVPSAPGISPNELADAFVHCREVTRERARNFYYGLRLTPEPRRSAIFAIYAWMRAADDAVDEVGSASERRERLRRFEDWTEWTLARAIAGRPLSAEERAEAGPLGQALMATIGSYPLDPAIFRDMLAGMRRDLADGDFEDDAELTRYCYCVAGTAGLACVAIWGLREGADAARVRTLSLHRGQAFQRTNILRDFAEDFDGADGVRRVYLPRETFDRHGLTAEGLRNWEPADRCTALVREQAAMAREYYLLSSELESLIDPACAPTLWAMTRIYSGLLEQIEADPARVVGARVRLASATKATIAIRAAIGARMHRW